MSINTLIPAIILSTLLFVSWAFGLFPPSTTPAALSPILSDEFRGTCDGSAAVALDDRHFVVANDEDNVLRIYDALAPGEPVASVDLSDFLHDSSRSSEKREADIEGAARIDDVIYWITSHGANSKGKARWARHRIFATRIVDAGDFPTVEVIGQFYSSLLTDLSQHPDLAAYGFPDPAVVFPGGNQEGSQNAPKEPGALNIEGLAATPDGQLMIGFRNPIPDNQALIVPLLNPSEIVSGNTAQLGPPHRLSLGGLGIRGMEYWSTSNAYVILGGRYDSEAFDVESASRLFRWDGVSETVVDLGAIVTEDSEPFNPEALLVYTGDASGGRLQVLSDDGRMPVGKTSCKDADPTVQRFRGHWLSLPPN